MVEFIEYLFRKLPSSLSVTPLWTAPCFTLLVRVAESLMDGSWSSELARLL